MWPAIVQQGFPRTTEMIIRPLPWSNLSPGFTRKKGMYVKADFAYDADADIYRCPAGEALTYRYTTVEAGLVVRRYWASVCQTCPLKTNCTTGKQRRITPLSADCFAIACRAMDGNTSIWSTKCATD